MKQNRNIMNKIIYIILILPFIYLGSNWFFSKIYRPALNEYLNELKSRDALEKSEQLRSLDSSVLSSNTTAIECKEKIVNVEKNEYRLNDQVVFIVGHPGSGTTLLRTILDVSPKIYCGYETRFIPNMLSMKYRFLENLDSKEEKQYVDNALRYLLVKVMERGKPKRDILCAKDPATINHITYLAKIFPNIKIVHIVRDGRGSALSIMKRNKKPMDQEIFIDLIKRWNKCTMKAFYDCDNIGDDKCIHVKYEDLVTNPRSTIKQLVDFLNIEFIEEFLHHEKSKNVDFSGRYQDKTQRKINDEMLNSWDGVIEYNKSRLTNFKMFEKFGYEI